MHTGGNVNIIIVINVIMDTFDMHIVTLLK